MADFDVGRLTEFVPTTNVAGVQIVGEPTDGETIVYDSELNSFGFRPGPVYTINFTAAGLIGTSYPFSIGDGEKFSKFSYVVPEDSVIIGGTCLSLLSTTTGVGTNSTAEVTIVVDGNDTLHTISKALTDRSAIKTFVPPIEVTANTVLGLKAVPVADAVFSSYSLILSPRSPIVPTP